MSGLGVYATAGFYLLDLIIPCAIWNLANYWYLI